jgi:hypothetical protein
MERIRPVYISSASEEAAVVKGATCDVAEYNIKTDDKETEITKSFMLCTPHQISFG